MKLVSTVWVSTSLSKSGYLEAAEFNSSVFWDQRTSAAALARGQSLGIAFIEFTNSPQRHT